MCEESYYHDLAVATTHLSMFFNAACTANGPRGAGAGGTRAVMFPCPPIGTETPVRKEGRDEGRNGRK